MPELNFEITSAAPERYAAAPLLHFKLRIAEAAGAATPIHTVLLRCQVRIEPARRRCSAREQERLLDLFSTPDRWGQTMRPMLWTHVSVVVPAFTGSTTVDLPVPCSYDFDLAATRYFAAVEEGDLPLCFLFSGTIFHRSADDSLHVAQIPWEKEACFRLPAATWRGLMELYYPNSAWLCLRKDVFELLSQYRSRKGLTSWEQTVEWLLLEADEPVKS